MWSLLSRYRDVLVVAALLLYPMLSFLSAGHKGREPHLVDRVALAIASPLQGALTWVVDGVGASVSGYIALRGSHQEAESCRRELSQERAELNELREAQAENLRLKALLGYAEGTLEAEIVARVVGANASAHVVSLRLNRGESDGVHAGMPVVTADGVMGQVVRATGGAADVMLVTDPSSRIGAVVQRSRVRATIVGAGGGALLALEHVLRSDDVVDGDVVITSGTDGIFPKGLVLGRIENVHKDATGMFTQGRVRPAADLRRAEEVMVLPTLAPAPSAQTLTPLRAP